MAACDPHSLNACRANAEAATMFIGHWAMIIAHWTMSNEQ
jgi:hypothetical protein